MTNFVFDPTQDDKKKAVQQLFGNLSEYLSKNDHGRVENQEKPPLVDILSRKKYQSQLPHHA